MNKKIVFSGMSIIASLALMSGATFAFFSDQATSQDNTFSTGTADLQIAQNTIVAETDTSGTYGNDIPAPAINEADILPGFSKQYKFWLRNNSSAGLTMDVAAALSDIQTTGNADIQNQLTVTINCGTQAGPAVVSGFTGGPYPVKTALASGQEVLCTMDVSLPNSLDSTYQASSVRYDGVFTGTQTP